MSRWINPHDRVILTICEHIGAEEAVGVGGSEGVGVNEPAARKVVVPALEVVEARFAVVVVTAVTQGIDVPDEGGRSILHTFVIVHGVVAPRAVGAAAQRDTADNDDDLWLCADGCTHHSDHLSIFPAGGAGAPPAAINAFRIFQSAAFSGAFRVPFCAWLSISASRAPASPSHVCRFLLATETWVCTVPEDIR